MRGYGELIKIGVEGTGRYGCGLARYLAGQSVEMTDVIRSNCQARSHLFRSLALIAT